MPRSRRQRIRMSEPRTAMRGYTRTLLTLQGEINATVGSALAPLLDVWEDSRGDAALVRSAYAFRVLRNPRPLPPRPDVVTSQTIQASFVWARARIGRLLRHEDLDPVVGRVGEEVGRHVVRELGQALRINIRESMPEMRPLIDAWRGEGVSLIESSNIGPMDGVKLRPMLDEVSDIVETAHAAGTRVEVLAGRLQDRFGISDRRAELIARDQTLKLNSRIQRQQQEKVGVTQYIWRTSGDERVRDDHAVLDGTIQSWDSPPEVAPGRNEHPGGDYQCRCQAEPVLPDWLG